MSFDAADILLGAKEELEKAPVRSLTKRLIIEMALDLPLNRLVCDDFGVQSAEHYRALRECMYAATQEKTIVEVAKEFDQALGNGEKLTALVKKYAPDYAVSFTTIWDGLTW